MTAMMIDCHTHIFPDRIAPKVIEMNEKEMDLKPYGTGTLSGLLSYMDEAGLDFSVVLGVAPMARLVKSTNDWLLSLSNHRVIVFGTVTPDYENWKEEIRRLESRRGKRHQDQFPHSRYHPRRSADVSDL